MTSKRETPLSREEILTAALHIVDVDGPDGLSMRRLARALGIEAMSLYHHFPNKDAIIEGVIELSLTAELEPPSNTPPADWKEPVFASVVAFRRALVSHPNVLKMMAAHPPVTPGTGPFIEGPLRYLAAEGFSEKDAGDLFAGVFALAFGHALLSASYPSIQLAGVARVEFTEESFRRTLSGVLHGYEASRGSV